MPMLASQLATSPCRSASQWADLRHDLRTPIGHLIGYAEICSEDLEDLEAADSLPSLIGVVLKRGRSLARWVTAQLDDRPDRLEESTTHQAKRGCRCRLDQASLEAARLDLNDLDAALASWVAHPQASPWQDESRRMVEASQQIRRLVEAIAHFPCPAEAPSSSDEWASGRESSLIGRRQ